MYFELYILCTDLEAAEEHEEEKKEPLTPITDLSFPPTLHIPEYFGLVSSYTTTAELYTSSYYTELLIYLQSYMHIHDTKYQ